MGRKKKEEFIINKTVDTKLNFDDDTLPFVDEVEDQEKEDGEKRAEILVGDNFKIVVSKRCFEVLEYSKTKKRNSEKEEDEEVYSWKSHGYPGSLKHALHIIGDTIAKNKMFDKKTISSVSEAVHIYEEAYKIVENLFHSKEGKL